MIEMYKPWKNKLFYHVVNGSGNEEHCFNFKCQNKAQHNSDVKEYVKKMCNGYSSNRSIRNVIFQETGCILSLPNSRYLRKKILEDTGKSNKEVVTERRMKLSLHNIL